MIGSVYACIDHNFPCAVGLLLPDREVKPIVCWFLWRRQVCEYIRARRVAEIAGPRYISIGGLPVENDRRQHRRRRPLHNGFPGPDRMRLKIYSVIGKEGEKRFADSFLY